MPSTAKRAVFIRLAFYKATAGAPSSATRRLDAAFHRERLTPSSAIDGGTPSLRNSISQSSIHG
jgi:hypothetical protein